MAKVSIVFIGFPSSKLLGFLDAKINANVLLAALLNEN